MAKRKKIPYYIDVDTGTTYTQNKKTGQLTGRIKVDRGFGDRTAVRRVKSGDSRGQIHGRTVPLPVKRLRSIKKRGLASASKSTRRRVSSMGGRARR